MIKNRGLFFVSVLAATASCTSTKPVESAPSTRSPSASRTPEFVNNVSIQPGVRSSNTGLYHTASREPVGSAPMHHGLSSSSIEHFSPVQFKYAILLDAAVEEMGNEKLFGYIDEWRSEEHTSELQSHVNLV